MEHTTLDCVAHPMTMDVGGGDFVRDGVLVAVRVDVRVVDGVRDDVGVDVDVEWMYRWLWLCSHLHSLLTAARRRATPRAGAAARDAPWWR
jgi:hypothetical protein